MHMHTTRKASKLSGWSTKNIKLTTDQKHNLDIKENCDFMTRSRYRGKSKCECIKSNMWK